MKFNALLPELYVRDFRKSLDFFIRVLGFKKEYGRPTPQFAFLSYQGSQLMIQEEDNDEDWQNGKPEFPYGRGLNLQIETDNVQKIADALVKEYGPLKNTIKENWYKKNNLLLGHRELLVTDPDGYLLRFSQPLEKKISNHLKPELYVSDFQKSLDFYTETLGFTKEYDRTNPKFAFLSYQGSQLMIQEEDNDEDWHNGKLEYPYGRELNFQIHTDNVEKVSSSLKAFKYPLKRGVKDSWYKAENILFGCREILVMDLDGYLLRFSQGIGEKPAK